jgi:hypothetical protein
MSVRWATGALAVALAAAAILIGIEIAGGGTSYGAAPPPRNPCAAQAPFAGGGLDGATQRVALRGLDVAACKLGLTREQLLFALAGQEDVGRSGDELEAAVRQGLEQAVDEEDLNPVAEFALRQAIRYTPTDWVLAAARRLGLI